jgi:hypothetical protein
MRRKVQSHDVSSGEVEPFGRGYVVTISRVKGNL